MSVTDLPMINAFLNGLSTIFLTLGYVFIKQKKNDAHRNCMIAAFVTSTVFLTGYLVYHYNVGHTTFQDPSWFRPYYLTLLFTHIVLAVVIVPLIFMSLYLGWKQRLEKHKKVSRWTWPLWMYVSVTGVLIYLILYQIFPQR